MKRRLNWALFSVLAVWSMGPSFRVDGADFFEREEAIDFRLEAPLSSLRKQRGEELEWLEGKLVYQTEEGLEAFLNIKMKARGDFRRQRVNCHFPPYWLDFRKSEVKGSLFGGLDKVKVVSHCNPGKKMYEPYLYLEYLAYRTYNTLTDLSFRVRLANITYFDTDKGKGEGEYAAFFIEHVDSLEKRLRVKQVKDKYVLPSRYNLPELCLAEMFQFFLGNTDFSYFASEEECCHNSKAFARKGSEDGLFPVPYDFDMAGLVDAPYAAPDPHFPIDSVTHRMYRGVEMDHQILTDAFRRFADKKEEIYELWESFELLSPKRRAQALSFIDDFYRIFEKDKKAKRLYLLELRSFKVMEEMIQEAIEKEALRLEKEKAREEKRERRERKP